MKIKLRVAARSAHLSVLPSCGGRRRDAVGRVGAAGAEEEADRGEGHEGKGEEEEGQAEEGAGARG